jgi:hypothetical protein
MIMQPPLGRILTVPAGTLNRLWTRVKRVPVCGWGWLRYYCLYKWQAKQVLRSFEAVARRRDLRRRSN